MRTIGFVGLGTMGRPMSRNLLKAGFELVVVGGHAKDAVEEFREAGAKVCDTLAELARASDAVLTCVPDSPDVEQVYLDNGGILEGAHSGLIAIDFSTIAPDTATKVYKAAKNVGVAFLDAPVSGGETGAIAGTLSIMVGGDADAVEKSMPVLNALGKRITHIGPSGCGQYAKAANQIILSCLWEGIGEALVLVSKAGADAANVLQAVAGGSARGWILQERAPLILKREFKPGFKASLQHKDLLIALEAGKRLGVPLPATTVIAANYAALKKAGRWDWDTSAVVTIIEDAAGTRITEGAEHVKPTT
jgi:3-hydroxyisobutyrate dehydrogenase-like beta-hydroxyacid dehydrogenase